MFTIQNLPALPKPYQWRAKFFDADRLGLKIVKRRTFLPAVTLPNATVLAVGGMNDAELGFRVRAAAYKMAEGLV